MLVEKFREDMNVQDKLFNIITYIVENTDVETMMFYKTYKDIQKDLNVSSATVAKMFNALKDNGFIQNVGFGWKINMGLSLSDHVDNKGFYFLNNVN